MFACEFSSVFTLPCLKERSSNFDFSKSKRQRRTPAHRPGQTPNNNNCSIQNVCDGKCPRLEDEDGCGAHCVLRIDTDTDTTVAAAVTDTLITADNRAADSAPLSPLCAPHVTITAVPTADGKTAQTLVKSRR